ncbi:MAG: hypothetical protein ACPGPE_01655 [Planctomycetota bacterium]
MPGGLFVLALGLRVKGIDPLDSLGRGLGDADLDGCLRKYASAAL